MILGRTNSVEGSQYQIEDGNGLADLRGELQDDSCERTAGLEEFLVAPLLIIVDVHRDLRQLGGEQKGAESNQIRGVRHVVQVTFLFQEAERQGSLAKAEVEEGRGSRQGRQRSGRNYGLARHKPLMNLEACIGTKAFKPSNDCSRSLLHVEGNRVQGTGATERFDEGSTEMAETGRASPF